MKFKKIINVMLTLLVGVSGIAIARGGGHGGGGHGGGGRGGGGRHGGGRGGMGRGGHHASARHAGGRTGGHRAGARHVTGARAGNRGFGRGGGWGRGGWNRGWGWGYGGWLWGATAAIIAGAWLFGGWTYDQWQDLADQDPERREYFETVVQPAYQEYQADPSSVPVRDAKATNWSRSPNGTMVQ